MKDITLPSGKVITDVPLDITQAELKKRALASGRYTEDDFKVPSPKRDDSLKSITLPSGKTITDVPSNITQEELKKRALASGRYTEDDFKPTQDQPETQTEGVLQEIGEGIASGLIAIPQGIGELVGSGIDLMFDTNFGSNPARKANELRAQLGIDPEGFAGKAAEIVTQFVVPGLGAASAVSKASKLGKLQRSGAKLTKEQKFALGAEQLGAAVGADIMVSTDGITTIGDFFEGGPTQTQKDTGLEGREEAFRKITNKLKIGTETGAIVATAPVALGAAATGLLKTADVVGDVAAPVLSPVAKAVKESAPVQGTQEYLTRIENTRILSPDNQNAFERGLADFVAMFRPRGMLPQEVADARNIIGGTAESEIKVATKTLNELEATVKKITKDNTPFTEKQIMDNVEAYINPGTKKGFAKAQAEVLDNLPTEIQPIVVKLRGQVDDLTQDIIGSDLFKTLKSLGGKQEELAATLTATLQKNMGAYLRTRYLAYTDPNYTPSKDEIDLAVNLLRQPAQYRKNRVQRELNNLHEQNPVDYTFSKLGLVKESGKSKGVIKGDVTEDQARLAVENIIATNKQKAGRTKKGQDIKDKETGRVAAERLFTGLFKDKKNLKDFERILLGEIKDPREKFIGTVADLAEFNAVDKYFGTVARLADSNEGVGRLFVSPNDARYNVLDKNSGYQVLGNLEFFKKGVDGLKNAQYGALEGYKVPQRVYQDITKLIDGNLQTFDRLTMGAYSTFLRAKGFTQYGKTVLSPITQIRNVTSAALFALANGNAGKGANVFESVRLIMDDIKKLTPEKQLEELREAQSLGVMGTQAELQEIRRLINEGAAVSVSAREGGVGVGEKFGKKIAESKGGAFLQSAGKKIAGVGQRAEDLYQGGDNIWKIYNFKFEQSKLRNALSRMDDGGEAYARRMMQRKGQEFVSVDDFIKKEAADIVRNTVPNYNLAPEVIKGLRKLPVGNFIAFPYEILRTSANIIGRGIDELASDVPEIQKIGLRRLTGASATFAIFPAALSEFAEQVTGVSEEEIKAYQRSAAAPWERNARLIPTGRDKDGKIQYINYSYTNPYDMLERFVNGAVNKFEEGKALGKPGAQATAEAGFEALTELLSPFLEESIITAKMRDVLPSEQFGRGGRTQTGAKVYNREDSIGDKMAKSFRHVLDAIIPSAVPVNVSGGEFEAGRFARAFATATGINDIVGISPKDKQLRERQFAGELVRALTGVTENTIDPKLSLTFRGYEFSKGRADAQQIFNTVINRKNLNSSEEVLDAYIKANEARFRVFNQFHQVAKDMKTLGLSDREIRRALDIENISGVRRLLRGDYEPLELSAAKRKTMRRNDTYQFYPKDEIRAIQKEQKQRQFGEPVTPTPEVTPQPAQPVTPQPAQPQAAAPVQAAVAAPTQAVAAIPRTSPTLVPNLRTQQLAQDLETRRG